MMCPECENSTGKIIENKVEVEYKPNGEIIVRTSKHNYRKCYKCDFTKTTNLKEFEDKLPY